MSVNSGGRSQPSAPVQIRTVVVAPELSSTSPSNDTILVTWSPVDHAVLYTLCIIREGSDSRLKLNTSNPFTNFDKLEPGTTYLIKGTAWDLDGCPGDDLTVCQITRPLSPEAIQVLLTQGRSVELSVYWQTVRGVDDYLARTSTGQNCSASERYCIISPLRCGQNHSVTVTAENSAGRSDPSDPEDFITFPCTPERIWVEEREAGSCLVAWTKMTLVEHYMAFIKRDDRHHLSIPLHVWLHLPHHSVHLQPCWIQSSGRIPCCPEDVTIALVSTETLEIMWSSVRGAELYETTTEEFDDVIHCNDTAPLCALSDLRCNTQYSVVVTPCSEIRGCNRTCKPHTHETAPCSPEILSVSQINSSSNVSVLYTASNTLNTNYTITAVGLTNTHTCQSLSTSCQLTQLSTYDVTAYASTAVGQSLPSYSVPLETGACCPLSVKLYRMANSFLRVYWRSSGPQNHTVDLIGTGTNHTCVPSPLSSSCDVSEVMCGDVYTVVVAPVNQDGTKVTFCPHRIYSGMCVGMSTCPALEAM
ncbi:unnamed protein product [Coregonus sp. 'balchen']|nr:unnamed protein product [Coregonus sp. 'balchen']